jgi:hypothetical protein
VLLPSLPPVFFSFSRPLSSTSTPPSTTINSVGKSFSFTLFHQVFSFDLGSRSFFIVLEQTRLISVLLYCAIDLVNHLNWVVKPFIGKVLHHMINDLVHHHQLYRMDYNFKLPS